MQNVSVIAWIFLISGCRSSGFVPGFLLLPGTPMMKFRRSKARDRLVLDEDVAEKLLDEPSDSFPMRSEWAV